MTNWFDGLPPLRDVIAKNELNAKKSLGQNFLLDLNLTSKIARQAADLPLHDVLEIGPGPGGLTRALLKEGVRKIIAIERDERCLPALKQISDRYPGRLTVLIGDALDLDPTGHLTPPIRIVANLPYNVGTELLVQWLTPKIWPPFWSSLTLMFQREVAQRIVAKTGSKAYGRLSLMANWRCKVRVAFDIPPEAFTPAPKVRSSLVHFERLDQPKYPADHAILESLIQKAFGQRRKMLRSSLRGLRPDIEHLMRMADIDPTWRAEQIDLERFCKLACLLGETSGINPG